MKFKLLEDWQNRDDIAIKGLLVKTNADVNVSTFISFDQPHLKVYKVDDNFYTVFKKFNIHDSSNLVFHQALLKYFEQTHLTIVDEVGYISVVTLDGTIDINVQGLHSSEVFRPYADMFEELLRDFYICPED